MLGRPRWRSAEELIQAVHDFVIVSGLRESQILRRAGLDPRFMDQLRDGGDVLLGNHDKLRNWMDAERARMEGERAEAAAREIRT